MPMIRRLPKFGFNNKEFKTVFEVVNVGQLETLFSAGETVDDASLRAKGLVRKVCDGVKVLGEGALTKKLSVKAHSVTPSAEAKIVKAGGTVERLFKEAPARKPKKVRTAEPAAKAQQPP